MNHLVPMRKMLEEASTAGYAVGAFEFWSLDSAQAVTRAAQKFGVPVILQNGDFEANHARGYDKMRKLAEMAAADVDIPVALHLDHAESIETVKTAIEAGYTSVMMDASGHPYAKNVEMTCRVVEMAKTLGISVESELGVLAGAEGNRSILEEESLQTDPDEAARFVLDTDIDALAVAIGTAHGFYTRTPVINIERLKRIRKAVSVPLVLHGGSGTPEDKIREAVANGIAKVNICTEFIAAIAKGYIDAQARPSFKYNVPNFFTAGAEAGYELVCQKLLLFGAKER